MTTKRKQILKAIAVSDSTTIDDLIMTTGLERKNLHDNIKAALKNKLCLRIKDDVTGQPAYKLTPRAAPGWRTTRTIQQAPKQALQNLSRR